MSQNDIYRVTVVFNQLLNSSEETIGIYVKQSNVTGFTVDDIEDVVYGWWTSQFASSGLASGMQALYAANIELAAVKLRKWDPLDPVEDISTNNLPAAGTDTSDPLPPGVAILVSLRTAQIGRSYRGRVFLPAPAEAESNDRMSDALALSIAKQFVGLRNGLAGINGGLGAAELGVYSSALGQWNALAQVKCDAFFRSQRRRNPRPADYSSQNV